MIKDYGIYTYSKKEWIRYFLQGAILGGGIGYLFYSNAAGMVIFMMYGFMYVKEYKKRLIEERRWQLNLQFRDGLGSISSALNAGYSVENGFCRAVSDLKLMYSEDAYIVLEFESIVRQIQMNQTIEEILSDFAGRSGVEDISNFAEVFTTAKRTGGNMIKIIKATETVIGDKIEVKREIRTLIAGKKFETNIMCFIPFGIILYLRLFSPGFLDPVYHNVFGVLFMTVLLVVYYFVYQIAQRIINIDV